MYYEVYIDVLFLVNLVMDYLLLLVTGKLLKCTATHTRIFLGSLTGALLYCLVFVLPITIPAVKGLLIHGVAGSLMILVALRPKGRNAFIKCFASLYLGAFLLGGVVNWLSPYLKTGFFRNFLLLCVLSYGIICLILKVYDYFRGRMKKFCKVVLFNNGRRHITTGLLDTGNCLTDPATGQKVHVVEYAAARELFTGQELRRLEEMYQYQAAETAASEERFHYIPFHSVGKSDGLLPAVTIDQMGIFLEDREIQKKRPVLAVCRDRLSSAGEYQIILNTDELSG